MKNEFMKIIQILKTGDLGSKNCNIDKIIMSQVLRRRSITKPETIRLKDHLISTEMERTENLLIIVKELQ
jgi:hypothetical protein